MSATNLTDTVKSLSNSTINNSVISPVSTWETRLQDNWHYLLSYGLGTVLCILIICISIFSKHITGDYKWFVLNQALANFFGAIGSLAYTLVILIWYSEEGYNRLYNDDPPLWVYIYSEATFLLMMRFGIFATTTTLFATVLNRWMAIVMPDHYQKFMSARLIVFYCTLCYVVVLPSDLRVLNEMMYMSSVAQLLIMNGSFLIPWLLSIILSIIIFLKLWNHMRTTTTITDKRRLQESRTVLYSLMIQIVVQFFEKVPYFTYLIALNVGTFTGTASRDNLGIFNFLGTVFHKIGTVVYIYSSALTCVVILITMRPYRRAVLSLISSITKFCQHYLKPNVKQKKPDNRVTPEPDVVNVRPAGNANGP